MITHNSIWAAIDSIAERYNLSPSGLARAAGLDATTFNKSKRFTSGGRQRWPSTESIAKVLEATGASFDELMNLLVSMDVHSNVFERSIPLIDMDLAGKGDYFDAEGIPLVEAWDQIHFPEIQDEDMFALEVVVDGYQPVYWAGDILVISPQAEKRRGDRVVVRYSDGQVKAHLFMRHSLKRLELASLQNYNETEFVDLTKIDWIYRIVWVRQ